MVNFLALLENLMQQKILPRDMRLKLRMTENELFLAGSENFLRRTGKSTSLEGSEDVLDHVKSTGGLTEKENIEIIESLIRANAGKELELFLENNKISLADICKKNPNILSLIVIFESDLVLPVFVRCKVDLEADFDKSYCKSDKNFYNIMTYAIERGKNKLIRLIAESCPSLVNKFDGYSRAPIFAAVGSYGSTEATEILLECKADLSLRDRQGCSVAETIYLRPAIFEMLGARGLDIANIKTKSGNPLLESRIIDACKGVREWDKASVYMPSWLDILVLIEYDQGINPKEPFITVCGRKESVLLHLEELAKYVIKKAANYKNDKSFILLLDKIADLSLKYEWYKAANLLIANGFHKQSKKLGAVATYLSQSAALFNKSKCTGGEVIVAPPKVGSGTSVTASKFKVE
jgi:hypothetical protein